MEAICIKVILQKSQEKENREVWGLWREDIERRHKGWLKCSLKISASLPHTIVEHLLDARHSDAFLLLEERQEKIEKLLFAAGYVQQKTHI